MNGFEMIATVFALTIAGVIILSIAKELENAK